MRTRRFVSQPKHLDRVEVDLFKTAPPGWLTLVCCEKTKEVIGFRVRCEPPSVARVRAALDAVLRRTSPWPMPGVPDSLVVDDAPEFEGACPNVPDLKPSMARPAVTSNR